jgi:hypothetical protein
MGFVAEALFLMKSNKFSSAAKLLESHVNDQTIKPTAKIGIMAWIGECYLKSEDPGEAAMWFEKAGRSALACKDLSPGEKRKRAMLEIDQAITYYEAVDDVKGMGRMAALKYSMTNKI